MKKLRKAYPKIFRGTQVTSEVSVRRPDMVPIAALEDAIAEVNEHREALQDAREAVASSMRAVKEAQHVAIDMGRLNEALVAQYRNAAKSMHDGRHRGSFKDCMATHCKRAKELSGTVSRATEGTEVFG